MSIESIGADVMKLAEEAKKHLEDFVSVHMSGIHTKLTELGTEIEKAKTSPVVSEVESLLPPEVAAAVKLIENALIGAVQAVNGPGDPAPTDPAPVTVPPAVPVPSA